MKQIKFKKGFTIAELVIALMLIACIAMVLTPVIFSNTQTEVLMTALNKNYTALQDIHQAIPMLQTRGKISPGAINNNTFMQAIVLTQKVIGLDSDGNRIVGIGNKFTQYSNGYTVNGGNFALTQYAFDNINGTTIILKNGVYIINDTANNAIMVDINGKKSPNQTGRDIFFFQIVNNNGGNDLSNSMFRPVAYNNAAPTNCQLGTNYATSAGCADKYLQSGKME